MKRDFEEYFTAVQKDYNRMLKDRDKINEEIKKGLVSTEQREMFDVWFNQVKMNYDRISYMWYLLHLPPKFIQKIQQKNVESKMMKELKKYQDLNADKETVLNENSEALDNIENSISEE